MSYYDSKYLKKKKREQGVKKDSLWMSKILLSIIVLLSSLIYINYSESNKEKFKKNIFETNISFAKFNSIYNKYFGDVKIDKDEETVLTFNEAFAYKEIKKIDNYFEVSVTTDYMIPFLSSGIIVFIGEKENFGDCVIVQGNDGVDIWYGNVTVVDHSLYDYVSDGNTLGTVKGDKIYLAFIKDGQNISYEEYFE